MKRREFLKLCVGSTAAAALPSRANGEAGLKEIRIGTQKGGFFPAVRKRHTVEDAFKPLYVERKWIDFQFDPPLLEAVNVAASTSAMPATRRRFSRKPQAPGFAMPRPSKSNGNTQAIIVPYDSPILTLADLKQRCAGGGK